ncbi:endonuclease/exonuclease/phosphatase family protein [Phytomonospora endophytica]|uniref:Endonuclease/exonuclease/phosphatase (EEP) superfamily protein YafD n=1 Tax=Phytomonospora endophytica TaxID=714109 RepID=A0A841F8M6_9ACTN|nr:endonuclease/exonuclease/phosphatase family protein [Phytomonospora endophytica]MBB6033451.1 endonuclease/exonuclease/phosphatase (EEP) superfamily protein YafD [Phytomonospora endophytica]GIG65030.1 endonuclease [Phytomonospora endophytica]
MIATRTPRALPRHLKRAALAMTCLAAALALAFALMRLFGLEVTWPLRVLVSYTPYVTAAALLPALAALALRHWRLAVAALVAPLVLTVLIAPRALAGDQPDARGPEITTATVNLYYGHADAAAVVALADEYQVDVLSIQELTDEAVTALDAAGIAARFPYREITPGIDASGTGVYSRFPLTRNTSLEFDTHFMMTGVTIAIPGAAPVELLATHPLAPYEAARVGDWLSDLARLPRATPEGAVRILAGDFNATLDHAAMRDIIDSGYADAADAVGSGLTGTWQPHPGDRASVRGLVPPRVALDHVLVDERVAVRAVAFDDLPGGDHRPVIAALTLPAA